MDYYQTPQPFQAQETEAKETFIPWIAQLQKVSDNPFWADKKIRFYLSSKEKESFLSKIYYEDLAYTYRNLATAIIQETFVFPVVDYGSIDEVTEDEIVRLVTEEFRWFKQVSHIYCTKYLDGLQFAILLSPQTYDDQLMENLLNVEQRLRTKIKDKQIMPFDIDYLFNAKAFNLKMLGKEIQLIYG